MNALHTRQLILLRIRFAIGSAVLLVPLLLGDWQLSTRTAVPPGLLTGAGVVLMLVAIFLMPRRRYASWGYQADVDELVVRHGLMVRMLTIVPFGRVQHIDVAQGPVERSLGLATLVLNTAGTRGAAVRLPGLLHSDAEALRDHIRSKIRQDLM